MTKAVEPWERLMTSHDLFADLCDLYEPEFYIPFASRFDREPHPVALVQGVHETAKAYLEATWRKCAARSQLLKHSGVHLIAAGLAARRLTYALSQISKSDRASTIIFLRYERQTSERPLAQRLARFGPKARLQALSETSAALEAAIASFVTLPDDPADEKDRKPWALEFVEHFNAKRRKKLAKNHPMERAALAFQPMWEEFSSKRFARGPYKHDPPGYDSPAADALYEIIKRLDASIAPTLAGTAIENVRAQSE
mgnify:CR=1 FL=1